MKRVSLILGVASIGLFALGVCGPTEVSASESATNFLEFSVMSDDPENGTEPLTLVDEEVRSPDEFVQTYLNEDGYLIEYSIDTSEASFYDADGNELEEKPEFIDSPKISTRAVSGGSWQTGSGYSVCTGMKVTASIFNAYKSSFKVNFELNQSSRQGKINKVYGTEIQTYGYYDYSWTTYTKIFRAQSSANARAYAGHQIKLSNTGKGGGSSQVNNFFQIKGLNYSQTSS